MVEMVDEKNCALCRQLSESKLDGLSEQLVRLTLTIDRSLEQGDRRHDKIEKRVSDLEKTKSWFAGGMAAAGFVGALVASLLKIFF